MRTKLNPRQRLWQPRLLAGVRNPFHGGIVNSHPLNANFIDPDPMQIATLAIAFIAAIAPFVQMYKKQAPSQINIHVHNEHLQQQPINEIERHSDEIRSGLKHIQRLIEQNCADPDVQFYEAPIRLLKTSMDIESQAVHQYSDLNAKLNVSISSISTWVMNIVQNHPELARRIGSDLEVPLHEIADRMNQAMADGRPIREAIAELKAALTALSEALEREIGRKSRN